MRLAVMPVRAPFLLATTSSLVLMVWLAVGARAQHPTSQGCSLHIEVRDARSGQPTAARCYLTDETGKPWNPEGVITYDKRQEHHFVTEGIFDIALLPGRYLLRVEHGPEYQPWESWLTLHAGKVASETVRLVRWI